MKKKKTIFFFRSFSCEYPNSVKFSFVDILSNDLSFIQDDDLIFQSDLDELPKNNVLKLFKYCDYYLSSIDYRNQYDHSICQKQFFFFDLGKRRNFEISPRVYDLRLHC